VEGLYEERVSFAEVKEHGDFGIGTFDHLEGEMVMLDGVVYQFTFDGRVNVIPGDALTPFACVTFYKPITHDRIMEEMAYEEFTRLLDRLLPSPNLFYAIRIEGFFRHVRTRSVSKQENYRPLVDVAKDQTVFDYYDTEGTLAGFFTPSFMSSINVPGFHLHFLSKDFTQGGHLLECRPAGGRIGIQFLSRLELSLPIGLDYLTMGFGRDTKKDLDQAEK
jgi:acetolactate decarboxylase